MELMFEDFSDTPYILNITPEQFHLDGNPRKATDISIWIINPIFDNPQKILTMPVHFRVVSELPCRAPWLTKMPPVSKFEFGDLSPENVMKIEDDDPSLEVLMREFEQNNQGAKLVTTGASKNFKGHNMSKFTISMKEAMVRYPKDKYILKHIEGEDADGGYYGWNKGTRFAIYAIPILG